MELNINLLPEPKKKRYGFILIVVIFALVLFSSSYQGISLYLDTNQQIEDLQKKIVKNQNIKTNALQGILQSHSEITASNYVEHYSRLHGFLSDLYLEPSVLLQEIGHQLPAYGKINSLSFQYDGKVLLEGTFKTMGDVAAFLHHLSESPLVLDAQVDTLTETSQAKDTTTQYYASFQLTVQVLGGDRDD
jgi:Tfp pilus assembly protein PilN